MACEDTVRVSLSAFVCQEIELESEGILKSCMMTPRQHVRTNGTSSALCRLLPWREFILFPFRWEGEAVEPSGFLVRPYASVSG